MCGRGVEASFLDDEIICDWLTGRYVQQPTAQKPVHLLDKGLGFPSMLIVSSNAEHCRLQESRHGTRNSWWLSRHLWGLASRFYYGPLGKEGKGPFAACYDQLVISNVPPTK
jgi:hypothetical protein